MRNLYPYLLSYLILICQTASNVCVCHLINFDFKINKENQKLEKQLYNSASKSQVHITSPFKGKAHSCGCFPGRRTVVIKWNDGWYLGLFTYELHDNDPKPFINFIPQQSILLFFSYLVWSAALQPGHVQGGHGANYSSEGVDGASLNDSTPSVANRNELPIQPSSLWNVSFFCCRAWRELKAPDAEPG